MLSFLKSKKSSGESISWIGRLFLGKKTIDAALWEELETILLLADVGASATQKILNNLTQQVHRKELNDIETLSQQLQCALLDILTPCEQPLILNQTPFVILTIGVNGAGKTTTIAKLAHYYQSQNKKILLAAGDTFRAAAIEQLKTWGERQHIPVIAQPQGSDSASVIFDAMQSAKARQVDLLIADTAGRLHTQNHLMAELVKIKRVIGKLDPSAPHEVLLVLDASQGQNALHQAKQFHEAMGVTGIVLTKLDGTAKGGIIFAIADQLQLPIRFIGVGEKADDLKPFCAKDFVEALFLV